MNSAVVALFGLVILYLGYRFYSKHLAIKSYGLNENCITPAHEINDGVDFVPTKRHVLLGHHYSSIAGAAPIVGPAIAVIWGWVPAFIWVIFGAVLIGAVHDFGSLVLSIRHKGESIGKITESIIGHRSRFLFLILIFLLIFIVAPVFALIIATLFVNYPGSVIPVNFQIGVAVLIGITIHRRGGNILIPSILALISLYFMIWVGWQYPVHAVDFAAPLVKLFSSSEAWMIFRESVQMGTPEYSLIKSGEILFWIHFLMIYGFIASILPVWTLLQPRDLINAHQLILGLFLIYLGLFVAHKPIVAPPLNTAATGSPPFIPFLFITIACGAISGFHSLVSSGTTSKQIDKLRDSRLIGYGGMLGEGALALASVLAATAGFSSLKAWTAHFQSWGHAGSLGAKISAFVEGSSVFLGSIGIPLDFAVVFISVLIISFANTSLDTAFRIQRYVVGEFAKSANIKSIAKNRYLQAFIAVFTAYLLAVTKSGGKGGMILWPLFGSTNQLIGGLALLVISVWILKRKKAVVYTIVPMVFLLLVTSFSLIYELMGHFREGDFLLSILTITIILCEVWIIFEAVKVFQSLAKSKTPRLETARI